jgi:hypothetical protein
MKRAFLVLAAILVFAGIALIGCSKPVTAGVVIRICPHGNATVQNSVGDKRFVKVPPELKGKVRLDWGWTEAGGFVEPRGPESR